MSDNFSGFFMEEVPQVKNAQVKAAVDNPILYEDNDAQINMLVAEFFDDKQLSYLARLAHNNGASVRIVYCFAFKAEEKHMVKGMARFFAENVRSDLNSFLLPRPVVTVGRAIYAATYDTDVQIDGFYDSVFNNTFFYSPFLDRRVYPIDNAFAICGFGVPDKRTGEPIYYWDRWETHFAGEQIKRAVQSVSGELGRKRVIACSQIENPNEWLLAHSQNIPENEMWVAVDSETSGFKKLEDRIGNISLSFDGWSAFYLEWADLNPRILTKFLNAHKLIFANGKFDILFFAYHGCDIHKLEWDTMVAGHFLNEMRSNSLKTHAFWYTNYGGYDLDLEKYKWKYPGLTDYTKIPKRVRLPYACMDAAVTYQVWQRELEDMKKEPELYRYYTEVAVPMINVFVKAEYKGFVINWSEISKTGDILQKKLAECRQAVREAYHEPDLDVNSRMELGKMLEVHGYPCVARAKNGVYKVSKAELNEWHKMGYKEVETIVEYSKWAAIWQTFIGEDASDSVASKNETDSFFSGETVAARYSNDATGLWKYKAPDGCIHTTFHPFMAQSHRHRSSDPNLQNIPKKNYDATKMVRTAYTTPDTIRCRPEEADKIHLLCKNKGFVSVYSGEYIKIGEQMILGKELAQHADLLEREGIRAEFYKFYSTADGNDGDYMKVEDDRLGVLYLPIWTDSARNKKESLKVIRNGRILAINVDELSEGDELYPQTVKEGR